MIYIIPLLMSIGLFILKEDTDILIYSIISLMLIILSMSNQEITILLLIDTLCLYWIFRSGNQKILIMLGSLMILGGYLSILSTSLISLFVSIEILSFTQIIIINLYIQDQYPGILYYLLSGLFTGIFILSLGYIYIGYQIAYKLIIIVFIFKLGLIPFHILLPLIYLNLSTNNIFIIDIPYKIILFYILIKLNITLPLSYIYFLLFFSSLASLKYKNLIYIMIYSSIFNYAIILTIINLSNPSVFIYYILNYSIFVLIYIYLLTNYFINKEIFHSYYLYLWGVVIFNLLGIPPLAGFFIKFYALLLFGHHQLYLLLIIFLLSSLIFSYTYLRILITMLMSSNKYLIINTNPYWSNLISILISFISFPLFFPILSYRILCIRY